MLEQWRHHNTNKQQPVFRLPFFVFQGNPMKTAAIRALACSFLFLTSAVPAAATHPVEKFLLIDGVPRALALEPSGQLQPASGPALHFQGRLAEFPESWARVSRLDGHWEGVVFHRNQLYFVQDLADNPGVARHKNAAQAEPVPALDALGSCASELNGATPAQTGKSASKSLDLASIIPAAASIDYPDVCSSNVDGVCLVAELSVFFDGAFRAAYPDDYRNRGAQILNIVEGIYRNQLGIAFNYLQMDFNQGDQFTRSNNPVRILEDMVRLRAQSGIQPRDPNRRSMMHLVSGRNFLFDDGVNVEPDVVGLAAGTQYQAGTSPLQFSPALCGTNGTTVGTSQLIRDSANAPVAAFTALVMAHELGHNLGMEHDGPVSVTASACDSQSWIMAAQISPLASEFSGCSRNAAGMNIRALPQVEACFDFPVDASLQPVAGQPGSVGANGQGEQRFNVNLASVTGQAGSLQVRGGIQQGEGSLTEVSLAGTACAITNGREYACTLGSPAATNELRVAFLAGLTNLAFQHQVSSGADHFDMNTTNNIRSAVVQVQGPGLPPTDLQLDYSKSQGIVILAWQDHASGDGNWQAIARLAPDTQRYVDQNLAPGRYQYRVLAVLANDALSQPSNSVSVTVESSRLRDHVGGSAGGGSLSWLGLGGLLALLGRRLRARS